MVVGSWKLEGEIVDETVRKVKCYLYTIAKIIFKDNFKITAFDT